MIDPTILKARDCLDQDDRLGVARQMAALGQQWEKEKVPGKAWAVYQLAHEFGANAGPAMARLSSAGAKLDNDYLRETRRQINGLDFPQPELNTVNECKPMLIMMWDMAKEALLWMSTFTDERVESTPWPVEGYQRVRELIQPPDGPEENPDPDDTEFKGEDIWRSQAPVGAMWSFLELTRGRNAECENLHRVFLTIGGSGARLYRKLALSRTALQGHEQDTVVRLVGSDPLSQQAAFAALWIWDQLQPEKAEPSWPKRAVAYAEDPALIVLTGMYGTVLQKLEGILLIKLK